MVQKHGTAYSKTVEEVKRLYISGLAAHDLFVDKQWSISFEQVGETYTGQILSSLFQTHFVDGYLGNSR